jgi:gas vesicle protein
MENNHKRETEGHSAGTVIAALLIGGIIGAGLGLLLAPESGENTRKKIWNNLMDKFEGIKDDLEEEKETVEE